MFIFFCYWEHFAMVPMDCVQECAGFFHFSHRWPGGRAEVCNGLPGVQADDRAAEELSHVQSPGAQGAC